MSRLLTYVCFGILFLVGILSGCMPSCGREQICLQDKSLADYQLKLLETAFDVAAAIPVKPHVKDRSRVQEDVVAACLKLDQPVRALEYAEKISNWRRGLAYADCAYYSVEHGITNGVSSLLDNAERISQTADQDWRRDRISARISQVLILLGKSEESACFSETLQPDAADKFALTASVNKDSKDFDDKMVLVDSAIARGDFDLLKNSLYLCAQLYDQYYGSSNCTVQAEQKIRGSWEKLPVSIRIDLLKKLAETSLKNSDSLNAIRLVNDAKEMLDEYDWTVEHHVPLLASLGALRYACGEKDAGHSEVQFSLQLFHENYRDITAVYRVKTLLPVAEAMKEIDDSEQVLIVYKQALEISSENQNARPRAEDLSAICISTALHNVEPNQALWDQIFELQSALGSPW